MSVKPSIEESVRQLTALYGDGQNGSCPTEAQWRRVLERPENKPFTMVNFFKFRETAAYPDDAAESGADISGRDAFNSYSSVSVPTMEGAGGSFLLVAPFAGTFVGADEDWDLVAIGTYPSIEAFIRLNADLDYSEVFRHRTAACARQKVLICEGPDA